MINGKLKALADKMRRSDKFKLVISKIPSENVSGIITTKYTFNDRKYRLRLIFRGTAHSKQTYVLVEDRDESGLSLSGVLKDFTLRELTGLLNEGISAFEQSSGTVNKKSSVTLGSLISKVSTICQVDKNKIKVKQKGGHIYAVFNIKDSDCEHAFETYQITQSEGKNWVKLT